VSRAIDEFPARVAASICALTTSTAMHFGRHTAGKLQGARLVCED
jgi:hypothetical protein